MFEWVGFKGGYHFINYSLGLPFAIVDWGIWDNTLKGMDEIDFDKTVIKYIERKVKDE